MLYIHAASRVLPFLPFGDGDGPVVYSGDYCHGNEKSVFDCQLSPLSNAYCAPHRHIFTLAIQCTDGEN